YVANRGVPHKSRLSVWLLDFYNKWALRNNSLGDEAIRMWEVLAVLLNIVLIPLSLFLILLVLIQRGKGGGLIGALGGSGGSSPFGSRAGDQFTRVTIYVALVWLLLIMIEVRVIQSSGIRQDATIQVR